MVDQPKMKARNIQEFSDDCARLAFKAKTEEDASLVILLSIAAWLEELKAEQATLKTAVGEI